MKPKIIEGILNKLKIPKLIDLLVNQLSFGELQSLMLHVFEIKTKKKSYKDIFNEYKTSRFTKPSDINPIIKRKLELKLFSLLPADFELIDLSPLAPLGTSSVLTTVHQNNIISTIRNVEVAADTTNTLAFECAKRRYELLMENPKSVETIKISSAQQITRAQAFENKNFSAHFGVIALCSAGRDEGNNKFEIKNLNEHIDFYINLIDQLVDKEQIKCIKLKFFNFQGFDNLIVIEPVKNKLVHNALIQIIVEENSEFGRNYYSGLRFMINIVNQSGQEINYIDGGFTNWTAKLLGNNKERLLTSGIGADLLLRTLKIKNGAIV